jgi:glycosyltransferase involved in cell wall biosynthesis
VIYCAAVIRVLHFAGIINRHDFIDVILQNADPGRFLMGACTCPPSHSIAPPLFGPGTPHWVLENGPRSRIPQCARRLARILRDWEADILHTHHYYESLIGWIATRLCRRTTLVIGRHYSDDLHLLRGRCKRSALLALETAANRAATRIVVPSTRVLEVLTRRQHVDREKIDLIRYGFDSAKYALPGASHIQSIRSEYGLEGVLSIGSFARLFHTKGQHYLVEAAALLRQRGIPFKILFAGEGPDRGALETRVRELELDGSVRFLGHRKDAMAVMASVDVVAQPTLREAFSQVMAEAMWMSRPLIMTNVEGTGDIVRHEENGLVVPPADPQSLADAVTRLAHDSDLRRKLGRNAREFAERHLCVAQVIADYERCYLRALGKTSA